VGARFLAAPPPRVGNAVTGACSGPRSPIAVMDAHAVKRGLRAGADEGGMNKRTNTCIRGFGCIYQKTRSVKGVTARIATWYLRYRVPGEAKHRDESTGIDVQGRAMALLQRRFTEFYRNKRGVPEIVSVTIPARELLIAAPGLLRRTRPGHYISTQRSPLRRLKHFGRDTAGWACDDTERAPDLVAGRLGRVGRHHGRTGLREDPARRATRTC
jgi:hypothetical protein